MNRRDWAFSLLFTVSLALICAFSFIGTGQELYAFFAQLVVIPESLSLWLKAMMFPVLAGFFYISLPKKRSPRLQSNWVLAQLSALPLIYAWIFGLVNHSPVQADSTDPIFWWYILFVPLGEEWLFRGWLYAVIERLWPKKCVSFTNPLPLAVWLTSLAFSLWHVQNFQHSPIGYTCFQMGYTFLTGIWLGYLRWKSGGVALGIVMHALINLLAIVS